MLSSSIAALVTTLSFTHVLLQLQLIAGSVGKSPCMLECLGSSNFLASEAGISILNFVMIAHAMESKGPDYHRPLGLLFNMNK